MEQTLPLRLEKKRETKEKNKLKIVRQNLKY